MFLLVVSITNSNYPVVELKLKLRCCIVPQNEFGFYRVDTPIPGSQVLERKALPQLPPNLPQGKYIMQQL